MEEVISDLLKAELTPHLLCDKLGYLTRCLKSATEEPQSGVLDKFLFDNSAGLVHLLPKEWMNAPAAERIVDFIKLALENANLRFANSEEEKNKICSSILNGMKRVKNHSFWKKAVQLLGYTELSAVLCCRTELLDCFCEVFLDLYAKQKPDGLMSSVAKQFYCKLVSLRTDAFVKEPSLPNLRSAIHLINFGFVLTKLAPEEYTLVLDLVSHSLEQLSMHPGLDGLRDANGQLNLADVVKFSMEKLLRVFLSTMERAPCATLSIVRSSITLFPQIITNKATFLRLMSILMLGIRITVQPGSSPNARQPAVLVLETLMSLLHLWERYKPSPDHYLDMLNELFDLFRVFPGDLAHAEARLRAWWDFICYLPSELLDCSFRRFVSPFLANLIGRYLSISAPLGDPQLHRYKLSQGNAYEGNERALQLAQHVFACFFNSPDVKLKRMEGVLTPKITKEVMAHNSYQLLVALVHWVHLLCGRSSKSKLKPSADCFPEQPVDKIWCNCIRHLLKTTAGVTSTDEQIPSASRSPSVRNRPVQQSGPSMVLQHVIATTCHLLSPIAASPLESKTTELPIGCPSPEECLNVVEESNELALKHPLPDNERFDVMFDLYLKLVELGGSWIQNNEGTENRTRLLRRWSDLAIRFLIQDPRFESPTATSLPKSWSVGGGNRYQFVRLVREVLSALLPDCVQLASNPALFDISTQESSMTVFLGQAPKISYSPEGLRFWSVLVDRLTQYIVTEQQISEDCTAVTLDTTTVQAALMAPIWLAGSTPPSTGVDREDSSKDERQLSTPHYLSNKDELALAKRLGTLFVAFHQEACLATTLVTNSWIDQLGHKIATLISAVSPDPCLQLNMNVIGRLLRSFAQNAERVQEGLDQKTSFNPFAWQCSQERPFGQLTGLLMGLKSCLLHIPWFDPPSHLRSPRHRLSPDNFLRILTSPPAVPIVPRSSQDSGTDESSSQSNLSERLAAMSYKISCGLIDALEAVSILIKEHARTTELLIVLAETLNPAFTRLANCCVQAQRAVIAAGTELDEPLLITQRRQQATTALQDVFVSLWQALGIPPVSIPEDDQASVLRSVSANRRQPSASTLASSTLVRVGCLLRPALIMSGVLTPTLEASCDAVSQKVFRESAHMLVPWLVGFWNELADSCPSVSKTDTRLWNDVRSVLSGHEETMCRLLTSLSTGMTPAPGTSRSSRSSTRGRGRPRNSKVPEATKSNDVRLPTVQTDTTQSRSQSLESTSPSSFTMTQSEPTTSPSKAKRGRRRLSLSRQLSAEETTPVGKRAKDSVLSVLSRSAPPKVLGRRGRGGRLSAARETSPRFSPKPGILAAALGIHSGSSPLLPNQQSWSPLNSSPGPLPGRPLVKRRLFMGSADSTGGLEHRMGLLGSRKRHLSDSDSGDKAAPRSSQKPLIEPPIPADFEDSAQFVFIQPAPDNSRKRRRTLTSHQKERFQEQKEEYIPITYTALDNSQQSLTGMGSDSQSQISQASWDQLQIRASETSSSVKPKEDAHESSPILKSLSDVVTDKGSPMQLDDKKPDTKNLETGEVSGLTSETASMSVAIPIVSLRSPVPLPDTDLPVNVYITKDNDEVSNPATVTKSTSDTSSGSVEIIAENTAKKAVEAPQKEDATGNPPDPLQSPSKSPQSSSSIEPKSFSTSVASKRYSCPPASPALTAPLPAALTTGLTSPLIRGAPSSRAQRMLALGLQKAAEKSVRHRPSGDSNSEPTTPENKPHVAASPSNHPPFSIEGESPSGIIRNLWSRKKLQRVSFAEQPTIITFGLSMSPPEPSHRESPVRKVLSDLTSSAINATTTIDESPPSQIDARRLTEDTDVNVAPSMGTVTEKAAEVEQEKLPKNTIATPLMKFKIHSTIPVDLDDLQSEKMQVQPSPMDAALPSSAVTNRRKSASPQRRVIVPRSALRSSPSATRKSPKDADSRKVRCPNRRRLFTSESPESQKQTEPIDPKISVTEIEDGKSSTGYTEMVGSDVQEVIVADSEAIEISDTQDAEGQPVDKSDDESIFVHSSLSQSQGTDDGCLLIEGSQGSQTDEPSNKLISEMSIDSPEESLVVQTASEAAPVSPPILSLHQTLETTSVPTDRSVHLSPTHEAERKEEPIADEKRIITLPLETTVVPNLEAEAQIMEGLSQISRMLPSLPKDRHQMVLMRALSAFKPIMH